MRGASSILSVEMFAHIVLAATSSADVTSIPFLHTYAVVHYTALRERYLTDRQGGGASPSLAMALRAIGWGAVQDPSAEEVADYLVELVDDCVAGHHDVEQLAGSVARLLRDCGPMLDGGLPPAAAYEAAALEMLEHYVRDGA